MPTPSRVTQHPLGRMARGLTFLLVRVRITDIGLHSESSKRSPVEKSTVHLPLRYPTKDVNSLML